MAMKQEANSSDIPSLHGDLKSYVSQGGCEGFRKDSGQKLNSGVGFSSSGPAALNYVNSTESKMNFHPRIAHINETDCKTSSDLNLLNIQPSSTQQSADNQGPVSVRGMLMNHEPGHGHVEAIKISPADIKLLNVQPSSTQHSADDQGPLSVPGMLMNHKPGHGHVEAMKIPPVDIKMAPAVKYQQRGAGQPVGHDSVDAMPIKVEPSQAWGSGYAGEASQMQHFGSQNTEGQISQREYIAGEKDIIFYELAERITGKCKLRYLALRLRVTESEIVQMEGRYPNDVTTQMYQILQLFCKRSKVAVDAFPPLLNVLKALNLYSAADWLSKRIDPNVDDTVPMETDSASGEPVQNGPRDEYFDIFLMQSGSSQYTRKIQEICRRHNWKVNTYEQDTLLGVPALQAIETILSKSTHLIILITNDDCARYRHQDMSTTVEMAYQQAQLTGELMGRVIPIRCCEKRVLPLSLQALTGVHITDANLEERLKITIDTGLRQSREAASQAR